MLDEIQEDLRKYEVDNKMEIVYENMLTNCNDWHYIANAQLNTISVCSFCKKWMVKFKKKVPGTRKNMHLLPLCTFRQYIQTLNLVEGRHMDIRILKRLSRCLMQTHEEDKVNFFSTCFTDSEKKLLKKMAFGHKSKIKQELADHYLKENDGGIFVKSGLVAEFLRKHSSTANLY